MWVSQTLVAALVAGPSYPVIRFVEDGMRHVVRKRD